MTTMWGTDEMPIRTLMRDVNDATLALPQFQRLSVWTKANWVPFLECVLKGRPTGTLLLMECGDDGDEFAARAIETAPDIDPDKRLKWLLLDGQQRLTTLYRAFYSNFNWGKGAASYTFVIDVKAALERRELLETDFDFKKKDAVPAFAALAEQGQVTLEILYQAPVFENWKASYVQHHLKPINLNEGDLREQLDEIMGGVAAIPDYKFPVLKIDRDTPLDVVVDIFEGMNRRGQKLNQFDLMVARLYRPLADRQRYDLRDRWEDALDQSPRLKELGVTGDDGMLPLQLIAKQVSRLGDPAKGVKGLTNKDVLELPAVQVIGDGTAPIPGLSLSVAVEALESASGFLHRVCGVRSKLLPQQSMLLPIADQYLRPEKKRLTEDQLKRWFFCTGLSALYHGSVNSYANRDCDDLTKWADDHTAIPSVVKNVTKVFVNNLDLCEENTREAGIRGKSIMSLLVATNALDWSMSMNPDNGLEEANPVNGLEEVVEIHHMVPSRRLKTILPPGDPTSPIAGLTPITERSNRRISDQDPGTVIGDLGGVAIQIMKSHQVDKNKLVAGHQNEANYNNFLKDRETRLKKLIIQSLKL